MESVDDEGETKNYGLLQARAEDSNMKMTRQPKAGLPTGGCAAPNAIVASIDLSPHSATKMSVPTYRTLRISSTKSTSQANLLAGNRSFPAIA